MEGGRWRFAGTLRTYQQMSQKILILLNGGRYASQQLLELLHLLIGFRIMAIFIQHSGVSRWTSYRARHPLLHVNASFLLVGKSQLSDVRSWALIGLKNYS